MVARVPVARSTIITMKTCTGCHEEKPIEEFSLDRKLSDGHNTRCKACVSRYMRARYERLGQEERDKNSQYMRRWRAENAERYQRNERGASLRRRYGIGIDDYERMFHRQSGQCAICGKSVDGVLHVDHDHKTGRVRGLLCFDCNSGIGKMKDDPAVLRRAATYLEEH